MENSCTIIKIYYVDNNLKSLPSTEEALQHAGDLQCLLLRGGLWQLKWFSKSCTVIDAIPEAKCAKEVKHFDLNNNDLAIERALEVRWCTKTDTFGFKTDLRPSPTTWRGIHSVVSSVYDPHGVNAPFVFPAKQLRHDLTQEKLGWQYWLAGLLKLSEFSFECCLKMNPFSMITSSQLNQSADASEIGFGSVSYLHLINECSDFQ